MTGGKPGGEPGENPSEQGRESKTNSTQSNPGHIGGKRGLLPVRNSVFLRGTLNETLAA